MLTFTPRRGPASPGRSSALPRPYSAGDVAHLLGLSMARFYQRRAGLIAQHGMPAPIFGDHPYKWHRASIDAWLARHHPDAPPRPANENALQRPAASDAEQAERHLAELHQHYASSPP